MAMIEELLEYILTQRYGKDVRQAIHDAIKMCYDDRNAGVVDSEARVQLSKLSDEINAVSGGNIILQYTDDFYTQKYNGKITGYLGWSRTGFTKCEGKYLYIEAPETSEDLSYNVFYSDISEQDGTDTYISCFEVQSGVTSKIAIPTNAKYFMLSAATEVLKQIKVYDSGRTELIELQDQVENINERVLKLENEPTSSAISNGLCIDTFALKNQIPEYWKSTEYILDGVSEDYLAAKIEEIGQNPEFIFATDYHEQSNSNNSILLSKYIMGVTKCGYYVGGSDILNVNQTADEAKRILKRFSSNVYDAFDDRFVYLYGNHDINTCPKNGSITSEPEDRRINYTDLVDIILKPNDRVVFDDGAWISKIAETPTDEELLELRAYNKLHFYFDDNDRKSRYIVMNTGAPESGVVKKYIGIENLYEIYLQLDWLAETLRSVPTGYNEFVFAHQMISENNQGFDALPERVNQSSIDNIATMLIGFKNKYANTVCRQNNGTYELLENIYSAGNHTYDFSNVGYIGALAVFSGHWHRDKIVYATDLVTSNGVTYLNMSYSDAYDDKSVPIIYSNCDAQQPYNPEGETDAITMTNGDITEQSFDVVSVDKVNRKINMVRIGAGKNRMCNY